MIDNKLTNEWNNYVFHHDYGTIYHRYEWKDIIEATYGHKAFFLVALKHSNKTVYIEELEKMERERDVHYKNQKIIGILPLIHIKSMLFSNGLYSLPFLDFSGILADDAEAKRKLLNAAIELGQKQRIERIEFRDAGRSIDHSGFNRNDKEVPYLEIKKEHQPNLSFMTKSEKVRMLLPLSESPDILMKSFKSKLRSQIRKPIKDGLKSKIGGLELIDDFYKVFSVNMRDLGSPIHSKKLIINILKSFKNEAKIVKVFLNNEPMAASVILGYKKILMNPWASSVKKHNRLNPNMMLYWAMLEFGCKNGFEYFDFGRSSIDSGTYKFKKQWGALPDPVHWHNILINQKKHNGIEKDNYKTAMKYWQKMPVKIATLLGPLVRKSISL